MNYELISKMTYAELRALEYDLNRVKCERSDFGYNEQMTAEKKAKREEQEAESRAFQLERNAEWDKQNQEEWEAKLRRREFLKTYQQRVDAFDITTMTQLPEAVGVLVLGFVGLEKRRSRHQNHTLVRGEDGTTSYKAECVLSLCRFQALTLHKAVCVANFGKMKLSKIKTFFDVGQPLHHLKSQYKFNSKENFIACLNKEWSELGIRAKTNEHHLLTYIASTR